MAKQIFNIVRILAVSLSLAVMAAGCIQEEDRILSDEEGKDASSFVSLCFITSGTPVTRSNPTGGEYGDGQEMGQDYESEIKTAVAFFFKGEKGVNSAPTTPIRATVVFQEFMEDVIEGHEIDEAGEFSLYAAEMFSITLSVTSSSLSEFQRELKSLMYSLENGDSNLLIML